ncbi:hypothetical protein T05_2719 [Trichinella murrelli]|uniref:Uncharacterized protein n=1 Tax=Trichinella murrelli TaxID=144512 RepID=A0A0V0TN31_9BILA|nr:hypothetical protein T05_2719 [Trichinella murrelli]
MYQAILVNLKVAWNLTILNLSCSCKDNINMFVFALKLLNQSIEAEFNYRWEKKSGKQIKCKCKCVCEIRLKLNFVLVNTTGQNCHRTESITSDNNNSSLKDFQENNFMLSFYASKQLLSGLYFCSAFSKSELIALFCTSLNSAFCFSSVKLEMNCPTKQLFV